MNNNKLKIYKFFIIIIVFIFSLFFVNDFVFALFPADDEFFPVGNYPVTDSQYIRGGYQQVANENAMLNITCDRRRVSMLVYVTDIDKTYRLSDIGCTDVILNTFDSTKNKIYSTTISDATHGSSGVWLEIILGGGGAQAVGPKYAVQFATGTDPLGPYTLASAANFVFDPISNILSIGNATTPGQIDVADDISLGKLLIFGPDEGGNYTGNGGQVPVSLGVSDPGGPGGTIYFDSDDKKFKASEAGGAYVDILGPATGNVGDTYVWYCDDDPNDVPDQGIICGWTNTSTILGGLGGSKWTDDVTANLPNGTKTWLTKTAHNVGIGTDNPQGKFEVYRPAVVIEQQQQGVPLGSAPSKPGFLASLAQAISGKKSYQLAQGGGQPLSTAAASLFIVKNSGEVGVGTQNPQNLVSKLTVQGDTRLLRTPGSTVPAGAGPALYLESPATPNTITSTISNDLSCTNATCVANQAPPFISTPSSDNNATQYNCTSTDSSQGKQYFDIYTTCNKEDSNLTTSAEVPNLNGLEVNFNTAFSLGTVFDCNDPSLIGQLAAKDTKNYYKYDGNAFDYITIQKNSRNITCASGTKAYAIRSNNGDLEFLPEGGTPKVTLTQAGNMAIGPNAPTTYQNPVTGGGAGSIVQPRLDVQADSGNIGATLTNYLGVTKDVVIGTGAGSGNPTERGGVAAFIGIPGTGATTFPNLLPTTNFPSGGFPPLSFNFGNIVKTGNIYFDKTRGKFLVSEAGSPYVDLVGGGAGSRWSDNGTTNTKTWLTKSTNNVGIGVDDSDSNALNAKLEVKGNAKISAIDYTNVPEMELVSIGDTSFTLTSPVSDIKVGDVIVPGANSTQTRIITGGGPTVFTVSQPFTSALSGAFTIHKPIVAGKNDDGSPAFYISGTKWDTDGIARLSLGDPNYYIEAVNGFGLKMGTYGAPDAFVLQQGTGNVGIGTTEPKAKLDVLGNVKGDSIETFQDSAFNTYWDYNPNGWRFRSSNLAPAALVRSEPIPSPATTTSTGSLKFYVSSNVESADEIANLVSPLTLTPGGALIEGGLYVTGTVNGPGSPWTRDIPNGLVSLTYSGDNVGIGTTTPQGKFEVGGGYSFQNPFTDLLSPNSGNYRCSCDIIDDTLECGSPSSSPNSTDISNGSCYDWGKVQNISTSVKYDVLLLIPSSFIVKDAGYVGIGTTNPGAKLQIEGVITDATIDYQTNGQVVISESNNNTYQNLVLGADIEKGIGYIRSIGYNATNNNYPQGLVLQPPLNAGGYITSVGIGTFNPTQTLTIGEDRNIGGQSNIAVEMRTPVNVTVFEDNGVGATFDDQNADNLDAGSYEFGVSAFDINGGETKITLAPNYCVVSGEESETCLISWSRVPGAQKYRVYKKKTTGSTWDYIEESNPRISLDGDYHPSIINNLVLYWSKNSGINQDESSLHVLPALSDPGDAHYYQQQIYSDDSPKDVSTAYVNKITADGNSWIGGGNLYIQQSLPGGGDLVFKGNGDDPGDIIFRDGLNAQKARIWSNNGIGTGLNLSSGDNTPDLIVKSDGTVRVSSLENTSGKTAVCARSDGTLFRCSDVAASSGPWEDVSVYTGGGTTVGTFGQSCLEWVQDAVDARYGPSYTVLDLNSFRVFRPVDGSTVPGNCVYRQSTTNDNVRGSSDANGGWKPAAERKIWYNPPGSIWSGNAAGNYNHVTQVCIYGSCY